MKHIRDCLLALNSAVDTASDIKPFQRELLYRLLNAMFCVVHEDWVATMYGPTEDEPKDKQYPSTASS